MKIFYFIFKPAMAYLVACTTRDKKVEGLHVSRSL